MTVNKFFNQSRWSSIIFVSLIFTAIAISQYVFVYSDVGYGIVISLVLALVVYIVISIMKLDIGLVKASESLILVPLYVLFTSSMPWFFIEQQYLLPMVYSLILGLCFWHMYEHDIDLDDVGLIKSKALKYTVLGALIAIPTGITEYLILTPEPAFPNFSLKSFAIDLTYMTFFVGLGEELLFRGLIQNDLKRIFNWKTAILIQGLLFGVMHMTWRSVPELGFTAGAGILLGYFYHRTGSLIGPISMHAVNNVILVGVLPYMAIF